MWAPVGDTRLSLQSRKSFVHHIILKPSDQELSRGYGSRIRVLRLTLVTSNWLPWRLLGQGGSGLGLGTRTGRAAGVAIMSPCGMTQFYRPVLRRTCDRSVRRIS
jgi:hypothetical protein